MSSVYVSKGFTIDRNRQTIECDGQITSVRPKTFALLLLFLEHPQELLSKRYLLDTVWDDVIVAEPVLVQSIRELRQLFDCADVIQTYPRKGYSWSAEVQKGKYNDEGNDVATSQYLSGARLSWRFAVLTFAIATLLIAFFVANTYLKSTPSPTEVVIVLPVKNEMLDSNYNWVALGAMDQLIGLLRADSRTQIMSVEYVLQLIRYTQLAHGGSDPQVSRVFDVSGASLVVEATLSGSVDDYRLSYKLHRKNDIKPGVIFDSNLESALQKLGAIVAGFTGVTIVSSDSLAKNAFHNELMARAIEKMDGDEFQLAANLLFSLKQLEPDNIVAREMLSRTLLQLKQFNTAKNEVISALPLANKKEHARLYLLLAEIEFQQDLIDNALETLDLAGASAESNNDTLYMGYIAQLRGNIQQKHGLFVLAASSYEQAVKYFSIIRCPIGASITHLQMADFFIKQTDMSSAKLHYFSAEQLIKRHGLYRLEDSLAKTQARIR